MPSYIFTGLTAGRTATAYPQGRGAAPGTSAGSGTVASDGTLTITLPAGSYRAEDGRSVAYAELVDDSTTQQADLAAGGGSATYVTYVGTQAAPVTTAGTARPSVSGPVYWLCAAGVTPSNAIDGDLIYNADA